MTVPSFLFLLFALGAAGLYNLPLGRRWREAVMLGANLALLLSFAPSPLALAPFAGFLALGYGAIGLLQRRRGRALAALMILLVLAGFVWLKRYSFVPSALFLSFPYLTVGLSYVFFRVMHLVIDAGQGDLAEPVPLLRYLSYSTNFLCLVAGPIQRYEDYAQQQDRPASGLDAEAFAAVAERIVLGLFKVMVVSVLLLDQQKYALAELGRQPDLGPRLIDGLQVVLIYPLYLYANFSGYCDVVVALGRLFRLDIPENFDRPFTSTSFIEFWSRWHITLSSWLKTYVYSPLMMTLLQRFPSQSSGMALSAFAFFVTFFLVGVWHGQTSEFLFFGLLQGGGVAVNKIYQTALGQALGRKGYLALGKQPLYRALCRGLTFAWFGFTLLWFWADWRTIGRLGEALGPGGAVLATLCAVALCALALALLQGLRDVLATPPAARRYARVMLASAQATAIWMIAVIMAAPPPGIVYKTF